MQRDIDNQFHINHTINQFTESNLRLLAFSELNKIQLILMRLAKKLEVSEKELQQLYIYNMSKIQEEREENWEEERRVWHFQD